ncbi:MAG: hypothetical protein J6T97_03135 [Bacteroidaceae bacterium]|nr:hypothetical protein [Bacteroidaceae bacterium]
MIATISADIVRSTSMNTEDLIVLRNKLRGLFQDFEEDYPGFWARIVRGDSIECFVPNYNDALRIAILIKLYVKMRVSGFDCSEMLQRYGIRFSIGVADIKYADKKEDIINGPAIYLSGRNLDEISRRENIMTAFEIEQAPKPLSNLLDSYVAMVSGIVDSYSAKQAEVVFLKLLGFKEIEISERVGISQSSVNTRAANAQWGLLNTAIKDFEALEIEQIS